MKKVMVLQSGRAGGKTLLSEKIIAAHLKLNPTNTIVRVINGEVITEKFVLELGPLQIEDKED